MGFAIYAGVPGDAASWCGAWNVDHHIYPSWHGGGVQERFYLLLLFLCSCILSFLFYFFGDKFLCNGKIFKRKQTSCSKHRGSIDAAAENDLHVSGPTRDFKSPRFRTVHWPERVDVESFSDSSPCDFQPRFTH